MRWDIIANNLCVGVAEATTTSTSSTSTEGTSITSSSSQGSSTTTTEAATHCSDCAELTYTFTNNAGVPTGINLTYDPNYWTSFGHSPDPSRCYWTHSGYGGTESVFSAIAIGSYLVYTLTTNEVSLADDVGVGDAGVMCVPSSVTLVSGSIVSAVAVATTTTTTTTNPCGEVSGVTFDPPAGSIVGYPVSVVMTTTEVGGVIHYETGGESATSSSPIYTGPVEVGIAGQIHAIVVSGGCQSENAFTYYTDYGASFVRYCDTSSDKVGHWGNFTPNGSTDHKFFLSLNLTSITEIVRLELYRCGSDGIWEAGRAWSTKLEIYPPESGGEMFPVYPLAVWENGVQLNSNYLDTLGNFSADIHSFTLYADGSETAYFRLFVFLGTGDVIRMITGRGCNS